MPIDRRRKTTFSLAVKSTKMEVDLGEISCDVDCTRYEEDRIILLVFGVTGLSAVVTCSLAVVVVLCSKPPLHKLLIYRLSLYQVIASLALSAADGLALLQLDAGISRIDFICIVSGFLLEYCLWVKLLFLVCLTFHLFFFAVLNKSLHKLEPWYIVTSILFPFVPASVPLATSSYGIAGAWCWIPDEELSHNCTMEYFRTGIIEQYTLWMGPVSIALVLDNIAVIAIFVTLLQRACKRKRRSRDESSYTLLSYSERSDPNKEALRQMLPLLAYPIIFFVLSFMPLVRRTYEVVAHQNSFILAILHAILGPSWGFFAGLALIVHICLIRRCGNDKQTKKKKFSGAPFDASHQTWKQSMPSSSVPSSAVTRYIIPQESEVDEELAIKK